MSYSSDKAILTSTNTGVSVEAEVDNFREKDNTFDAFIASSRIKFRWNGKTYVGKMSGMEFTSPGPNTYN